MCGIAGYIGLDDEALLRAMCGSLAHRGPDEDGFHIEPGAGLCMRRLAVIDLLTGRQPIANETGDVRVVLNGEIYNYLELTEALKRRGHVFRTTSDTETIVHLYEDHGLDFVSELRGMFAIALWDARRRRLVLARDRIGEKPLYYVEHAGGLLFASEIKALLQAPIPRSVDPQAICEFLAMGYVPPPRSFFAGIRKLAPSELLVHEGGRVERKRFWRREEHGGPPPTFNRACGQLTELLRESVRLCLKSDVEVGAFLSGGIDSSVLVALMREREARVQTFSVGYGGAASGFNELAYARRVADRLGTMHHELILEPRSTMELLPRILWHYDEPHGEPTSVLVYLLSEFTQKRVKVAIGGTGGDEIFFGYPRHVGVRVLDYYMRLPRWLRERVIERVILRWPESTRGKHFAKRARRFVTGAGLAPEQAYAGWVSLMNSDVRARLVAERMRCEAPDPSGDRFLREILDDQRRGELLRRAADLDVLGYLPEYQLAYVDRMSMAHGLEVRSPLCDYRLVDFATGLPSSYRLRGLRTKHIFKRVATQWIPGPIARRKKVGFDSPIGQWAKSDIRSFVVRFLSPEHVDRSGLLDSDMVQRLLGEHLSGRRDHSLQLWSLLALEGWYRMYIEDGVADGRHYSLEDMRGAAPPAGAVRVPAPSMPARDMGAAAPWPRRRPIGARCGGLRRRLWEGSPSGIRRGLGPLISLVPPHVLLGRDLRRWLEFARSSESWGPERVRAFQIAQLREVCSLANERTTFYREHFRSAGFDPRDLREPADLHGVPTIDRGALDEHLDRMAAIDPSGRGVDSVSTGGTNGRPLRFYIDADRTAIEYAHLLASWRRAGYSLGTPLAVMRGRVVAGRRDQLRHEYDAILRHHHYSSFHMSEADLWRYVEHIRTIGPCFLHVYPSAVATLARFLDESGLPAPKNVGGIIAESEIVYSEQRRLVERVFGRRYFSCYGHSEKLVLAAECEHSTDYHVWPTYGYFELLDEAGHPVTTPGQRGEIVGTGFINRVVPFIRYRTGDFATYVGRRCTACGREHPVIRDIRGHRVQEMLVASDGSEISWAALNMHDNTFANVRQFQFYQDAPGRAVLKIVPSNGFSNRDQQRIRANLGRKLDGMLNLHIQRVDSIPLSTRGKFAYVVQEIPPWDAARSSPIRRVDTVTKGASRVATSPPHCQADALEGYH